MIRDWVDVFARDERLANPILVDFRFNSVQLCLCSGFLIREMKHVLERLSIFHLDDRPISGPTSDRTSDHLLEPTAKTGNSVCIDLTLIFVLI